MTDLPTGWESSSLEALTDADRPICYGILMPKDHIPDGVPYVRVRDFPRGEIDVANLRRTAPAIEEKYRRSRLRGSDVLVSIRGTYGRAALVPAELEGGNITQDTARLAPVPGLHHRFLLHYLRSRGAQDYFKRVARGVAVKGVNIGDLKQLTVPLPPQREQERIVDAIDEYLSRVDAAEAALDASAAKARLLTRATVGHLFDDADWPWTTLGEIAEIKGGVAKDAKRQGDPSFVELPYLRVANVQRGRLDLREITTIRVAPERGEALRLLPGDVLFNEGGDRDKLGRGWVWEGQIAHCIHQNHVFRARLTTDAFDPYFVSTHANTWGQAWFERHGRQTTNLASINMTTLKQFPVPAPPIAEQAAIVAELQRNAEVRDRLIAEVERSQRRVSALRSSILAAAFCGQLVPQDPTEEPAAVLLDRIREERRWSSSPSVHRKTAATA